MSPQAKLNWKLNGSIQQINHHFHEAFVQHPLKLLFYSRDKKTEQTKASQRWSAMFVWEPLAQPLWLSATQFWNTWSCFLWISKHHPKLYLISFLKPTCHWNLHSEMKQENWCYGEEPPLPFSAEYLEGVIVMWSTWFVYGEPLQAGISLKWYDVMLCNGCIKKHLHEEQNKECKIKGHFILLRAVYGRNDCSWLFGLAVQLHRKYSMSPTKLGIRDIWVGKLLPPLKSGGSPGVLSLVPHLTYWNKKKYCGIPTIFTTMAAFLVLSKPSQFQQASEVELSSWSQLN